MNGVPQTAEISEMAKSFMLKAKAPSNVNIKTGFRVSSCLDRFLFAGKIFFDLKILLELLSWDFKSSGTFPMGFVYCQYFQSENICCANIFAALMV